MPKSTIQNQYLKSSWYYIIQIIKNSSMKKEEYKQNQTKQPCLYQHSVDSQQRQNK